MNINGTKKINNKRIFIGVFIVFFISFSYFMFGFVRTFFFNRQPIAREAFQYVYYFYENNLIKNVHKIRDSGKNSFIISLDGDVVVDKTYELFLDKGFLLENNNIFKIKKDDVYNIGEIVVSENNIMIILNYDSLFGKVLGW